MAAKKAKECMLINRRTKKALQATGLDNGCVVEQAEPNGSAAQLWLIEKNDDTVKIINKHCGKVLDVMAEGTGNGTWLQTWEDVGGGSQAWRLDNVTSTYKKLVNVRADKVADIVDMSSEDGAPAQIWEDVDGVGQQWKLVSADKTVKSEKTTKTVTKTKKAATKKTVKSETAAPAAKKEKTAKPAEKKSAAKKTAKKK